jgi:hypothetical protein
VQYIALAHVVEGGAGRWTASEVHDAYVARIDGAANLKADVGRVDRTPGYKNEKARDAELAVCQSAGVLAADSGAGV